MALSQLFTHCLERNTLCRRTLEQVGFQRVGRQRYGKTTNGYGYIHLRDTKRALPEQLDTMLAALGKLSKEDRVAWQQRLAEKGWAARNWPAEHGGAGFTASDLAWEAGVGTGVYLKSVALSSVALSSVAAAMPCTRGASS